MFLVRPKRYFSNDTLLALRSASLLPVNSNWFALSVVVLLLQIQSALADTSNGG